MKRYYIPNQRVKTADGFELSITTYGTAYLLQGNTQVRLDSLWAKVSKRYWVELPNGRTAKFDITKDGLKEVTHGSTRQVEKGTA